MVASCCFDDHKMTIFFSTQICVKTNGDCFVQHLDLSKAHSTCCSWEVTPTIFSAVSSFLILWFSFFLSFIWLCWGNDLDCKSVDWIYSVHDIQLWFEHQLVVLFSDFLFHSHYMPTYSKFWMAVTISILMFSCFVNFWLLLLLLLLILDSKQYCINNWKKKVIIMWLKI